MKLTGSAVNGVELLVELALVGRLCDAEPVPVPTAAPAPEPLWTMDGRCGTDMNAAAMFEWRLSARMPAAVA